MNVGIRTAAAQFLSWEYFFEFSVLCLCSVPQKSSNASDRNSESLLLFLFHGTGFRAFFSCMKWFGTEFREFASIFVPLYGIPSIFLFHRIVRNGLPRVFCSAEQPEFRRNKPIVQSIPSSGNNQWWANR
jgi:hypothetical protein